MQPQPPAVAVVLAGGLGTRIRHLLDGRPKPLATVAGRPFLEWVLRYLHAQGLRRIVLSAGYAGEQIAAFAQGLQGGALRIDTVIEPEPLGTAGGFLHAWSQLRLDAPSALVLNGDSLALAPLAPLFAQQEDASLTGALLAAQVEDAGRYGALRTDGGGRLLGFLEKRQQAQPAPGLVNAGVYLLPRRTIEGMPQERPLSFETQVFPGLLAGGAQLHVTPVSGAFLDIGTPDSLAQADAFVRDNPEWFSNDF